MSDNLPDVNAMGRPPADEPLSVSHTVRFSELDVRAIEQAATAEKRKFGRWVRDAARAATIGRDLIREAADLDGQPPHLWAAEQAVAAARRRIARARREG